MWKITILMLTLCVASILSEKFQLQGECAQPLDMGDRNCSDSEIPSIRWYMDKETLTCLAFKYSGCGGNKNNFVSKDQCQRCLPMDFQSCPANSEPVRRADNSSNCNINQPVPLHCPEGAVCKMGFAVGLCCDAVISDKVAANYKPDCGKAKKHHKSEQFGFQLIHLGKSCSHDFCPSDSTCEQGAYFAYCCV